MDPLQLALNVLRDRRQWAARATDDEEQAQRAVTEAALDLLDAIAVKLVMISLNPPW